MIDHAPQRLGGDLSMHVHTMYRDPTNDYGRNLAKKVNLRLTVLGAVLVAGAPPVSGHQVDEYLQTTYISLARAPRGWRCS